eukprot:scaffold65590_cov57-Cyclotella_meneghiniana.AAC.1
MDRTGQTTFLRTQVDDATVELIWQDLVDFNPVTCGIIVITVSENGMEACRGGGDAGAVGEEVGRCGCSDGCFKNWILLMSYSVCSVES